MNLVGFEKETELLHTKVSTKYKRAITSLAATNGVDENIVANSLLAKALSDIAVPVMKVTPAPKKAKRRK